jgi:predicted secreted protein
MDFRDCRSMKVVFVPHCALNQNARLAACSEVPATVTGLVEGLMEREIGIIQLPCPELILLGLDREHLQIRSALDSRPSRRWLRRLARQVSYQIAEYQKCGVRVLGVLGKNGSPACGVEMTWKDEYGPGAGAFIEELQTELSASGLDVPVIGMVDSEPNEALAVVDGWVAGE